MKTLLCDILFALVVLIVIFIDTAFALQKSLPVNDGVKIEWEQVEGASGYEVEVETGEGTRIVLTRVTDNFYRYELADGQYRIRVGAVNKFDKVDVYSEWFPLSIMKAMKPDVIGLSISEAGVRRTITDIEVRGNNLMQGAGLFLRRGDVTIPAENCVYAGDEKIRFDLRIGDVPAGDYDLVVENPGGLGSVSRGMVRITDTLPAQGIFSSGIGIDAGYQYSQVAGRWSGRYAGSFIGGAVVLGYSFAGIDFQGRSSFLRNAGLEAQFDYSSYNCIHRAGVIDTTLGQILMGGNITYSRILASGFGVILRGGGGAVYTMIKENRQYGVSADYTSTDAFLRAGAGIFFMPVALVSLQVRIDYCPVMYREYSFHSIRYGLFTGVRF